VLQEALTAVQVIPHEKKYSLARALVDLAPYLSEPLLQDALAAARAVADESARAQALVDLAPRLSESLLQEALTAVRAIADEGARARALAGLVPHLSESLEVTVLQEALTAVQAIMDEDARARALVDLAPRLSESLLQEALATARSIAHRDSRARALVGLASHVKQFPLASLYLLWNEVLPILASSTRSNLLSDILTLFPVIAALGEKEALVAMAQAIIEVGRWFP